MTAERSSAGRPGRPRSARAHQAILTAAVALFIGEGFEGMSVEAVAARAGAGKSTIYRRWSSKEELVIDAVADVIAEAPRPDTGSVREDLVQLARELNGLMTAPITGAIFPRMAPEVARNSRLGRLYGERVIQPRRAILAEALQHGIERGELPENADVELAVDLLVGRLLLRRLTGRLQPPESNLPERPVDVVLAGLRASEG